MKRYTTKDESAGCEDNGLTLQGVNEVTDWTEKQFDEISELAVGQCLIYDGVSVERTK